MMQEALKIPEPSDSEPADGSEESAADVLRNASPDFSPPRWSPLFWRVGGVDRSGAPLFGWNGPHAYQMPYEIDRPPRVGRRGFHLFRTIAEAVDYGRKRAALRNTPSTHLYAMHVPAPYAEGQIDFSEPTPPLAARQAGVLWRVPLVGDLASFSSGDIAYKPDARERWHEAYIQTIPPFQWRYRGDQATDSIRDLYWGKLESSGSGVMAREAAESVVAQCAAADGDPAQYRLRGRAKRAFRAAIDWRAVRREAWLNALRDARRRVWQACPFNETGQFEWGYDPQGYTVSLGGDQIVPEFTPLESLHVGDWMEWVGVYGGVWDYITHEALDEIPDQAVAETVYAAHEACQRLGVEPDKDLRDATMEVDKMKWLLANRDDDEWKDVGVDEFAGCAGEMLDALNEARESA
jgi:hypothetical protein